MLTVQLDEEMQERLTALAKLKGRSKNSIVREAIIRYMEDCEDVFLVQEALRQYDPSRTKSLQEVMRGEISQRV